MSHVDTDPGLTYDSDTVAPTSDAFTHEDLAEIAQVYRDNYSIMLYRAKGYSRDPESIVQSTFEKALKNWNRYEDQGHDRRAWLHRILVNTALDDIRRVNKFAIDSLDDSYDEVTDESIDTNFDDIEYKEHLELLKSILEKNNKPQHWYEMVVLRTQGYTYAEIAKKLDLPTSTVNTGFFRLAKFLSDNKEFQSTLIN